MTQRQSAVRCQQMCEPPISVESVYYQHAFSAVWPTAAVNYTRTILQLNTTTTTTTDRLGSQCVVHVCQRCLNQGLAIRHT